MTGRLLTFPLGIGCTSIEPLSGPRTVTSGIESVDGFVQSVASPNDFWRFRFSLPPLRGEAFRKYRGWVTAMHGGANASRWSFFDPDRFSLAEGGALYSENQIISGVSWSNGQPWSNGQNWKASHQKVPVAAALALSATEVVLADEFWGYGLDVGDYIGFFPFHFGLYMITEVKSQPGRYRIWPPLRKAVSSDSFATLDPVLVMRLEGDAAAPVARSLAVADSLTITMVEVRDYDVRDYFTG